MAPSFESGFGSGGLYLKISSHYESVFALYGYDVSDA